MHTRWTVILFVTTIVFASACDNDELGPETQQRLKLTGLFSAVNSAGSFVNIKCPTFADLTDDVTQFIHLQANTHEDVLILVSGACTYPGVAEVRRGGDGLDTVNIDSNGQSCFTRFSMGELTVDPEFKVDGELSLRGFRTDTGWFVTSLSGIYKGSVGVSDGSHREMCDFFHSVTRH